MGWFWFIKFVYSLFRQDPWRALHPLADESPAPRAADLSLWDRCVLYLQHVLLRIALVTWEFTYRKELSCKVCYGLRYRPEFSWAPPPTGYVCDTSAGANVKRMEKDRDGQFRVHFHKNHRPPHPTLEDWLKATVGGCYTCAIVLNAVTEMVPDLLDDLEDKYMIATPTRTTDGKSNGPVQVLLTDAKIQEELRRETRYEIFQLPDVPVCWPTIGTAQLVSESNLSSEAIDRIWGWFAECSQKHQNCSFSSVVPDTPMTMPRRVIDVGQPSHSFQDRLDNNNFPWDRYPHIVLEDKPQQGDYVALSYCWGEKRNEWLTTTKANLLEMKKGISLARAPKTIRDAVYITQLLRVRYLWIDALCILQDDEDEWLAEGGKMADIYSAAALVISAASTADCTDGFLEAHLFGSPTWQTIVPHLNEKEKSKAMVNIESHLFSTPRWETSQWEELPPLWVRRGTNRSHAEANITLPITQRAWISQELLFSRRILYFTRYEMAFQCYNGMRCECGSTENTALTLKTFLVKGSIEEQLLRNIKKTDDADELFRTWRIITSIHSLKRTHSERDKLLTLSSIAKIFAQYVAIVSPQRTQYLAGIWYGDLVRSLCWLAYAKPFINPMDLDTSAIDRAPLDPLHVDLLSEDTIARANHTHHRRASLLPSDYITRPEAERTLKDAEEIGPEAVGLVHRSSWPLAPNYVEPWRCVDLTQMLNYPYEKSRPSTYIAPTWSWASVQLPICYPMESEQALFRQDPPSEATFLPAIDVLEAECGTSAINPTGPVTSGYIKVTGMLAPVQIRVVDNIPLNMHDALGLPNSQGPISQLRPGNVFLVLRSAEGHIGFARTDIAMEANGKASLEDHKCWLRSAKSGIRCLDAECTCRANFRQQDYYLLEVGTMRRHILSGSGWVVLSTCYLVLKSLVGEGAHGDVETFERIGVVFNTRLGSELSRISVFENATSRTVHIQ
ncbi:HET-domain-containing protein [Lentithecium fluviatile CBS 122367]|uniref:HET-domain-containing protein n=1 Tax=Lentithecium fluviatile CBS 122367 TaxID=1168545 RepID=A0A6G1JG75_9PLEO|nr:HET-domain-containing protein [Lentithecium fluviatile CBS 122367]